MEKKPPACGGYKAKTGIKRSSAPDRRDYLVDRRSVHFADGASALPAAAAVYLIPAALFVPDQASFDRSSAGPARTVRRWI